MAFETNKEPKLDVMQPDLHQMEEEVDEVDPIVSLALDKIFRRLDAIELFLVDFGWGE